MRRDHDRIVRLLSERWVFVLSTIDRRGHAYSTPLFYALDPRDLRRAEVGPRLLFVTDPTTHHGGHLGDGASEVSGATYLESRDINELRGVQFRGVVARIEEGTQTFDRDKTSYTGQHPVAEGALNSPNPPGLYALSLTWAKYTDNRLGFGSHGEICYPAKHGRPRASASQ